MTTGKMAVVFGVIFITLRELHAQTVTDADCRTWMQHNSHLATDMICCKCGYQIEEKEYDRVAHRVSLLQLDNETLNSCVGKLVREKEEN